MTKKGTMDFVTDVAIERLKKKALDIALVEDGINYILDVLEKSLGTKILNKPFKIELEKTK